MRNRFRWEQIQGQSISFEIDAVDTDTLGLSLDSFHGSKWVQPRLRFDDMSTGNTSNLSDSDHRTENQRGRRPLTLLSLLAR
jgi:hypothetical protein